MAKRSMRKRLAPDSDPVPLYSRSELMAGAHALGTRPEIVAAAMRLAGREMMTRREMESAIQAFLERRV